jgi:DNA-binding NarL/FixJ family response regulator
MGGSIGTVLRDNWSKVLSPREREVALLVARGLTNKEVARELGLCDGTVKIHVHSIFQKLGAKSRYHLIVQRGAAEQNHA